MEQRGFHLDSGLLLQKVKNETVFRERRRKYIRKKCALYAKTKSIFMVNVIKELSFAK